MPLPRWSPLLAAMLLGLAAPAGAPRVEVAARGSLPVVDGDHLVLAVALEVKNPAAAPLTVRAVDYVVSVQGQRLFAGTAQGFPLAPGASQELPVAGFTEGPAEAEVLSRLQGTTRFSYRVAGTVRAAGPDAVAADVPFVASGEADTPEEVAEAGKRIGPGRYSLLNY